jgi:hypothetical protein
VPVWFCLNLTGTRVQNEKGDVHRPAGLPVGRQTMQASADRGLKHSICGDYFYFAAICDDLSLCGLVVAGVLLRQWKRMPIVCRSV